MALALLLTYMAGSAAASHPGIPCGPDNRYQVYTAPDGEVWMCDYVPDVNEHLWIPLRGVTDPSDAVTYKWQVATDPSGVTWKVMPRLEWIGMLLYSGTDFFMRDSSGAAFYAPTGTVAHKTRVWAWDATTSTWSICRESSWSANNAPAWGLVGTDAWGNAPCGAKWYYATGFVERNIAGTWQIIIPTGTSTFGGVTLSGTTPAGGPSASNGMIWDPPPGDISQPPPPPTTLPSPVYRLPAPARPRLGAGPERKAGQPIPFRLTGIRDLVRAR